MLRMANLPFVGSDVLGSAACMDKDVTKRLLRDAGLAVAPFITLTRANRAQFSFADVEAKLGLPLFVKPANQDRRLASAKLKTKSSTIRRWPRPSNLTIKWWWSKALKGGN